MENDRRIRMAVFGGSDELSPQDELVCREIAEAIVFYGHMIQEIRYGVSQGWPHGILNAVVDELKTLPEEKRPIIHACSPWSDRVEHQASNDPEPLTDVVSYLDYQEEGRFDNRFKANGWRMVTGVGLEIGEAIDLAVVLPGGDGTRQELVYALQESVTVALVTSVAGSARMALPIILNIANEKQKNVVLHESDNVKVLLSMAIRKVLGGREGLHNTSETPYASGGRSLGFSQA